MELWRRSRLWAARRSRTSATTSQRLAIAGGTFAGRWPATRAWPRVCLSSTSLGRGKAGSHRSGSFSKVSGASRSSTVAGVPMSATTTSPHRERPGKSTWQGLLRRYVTVRAADTAPSDSPVSPMTPLGTSTDTIVSVARAAAASVSAAWPESLRARPAPKRTSTTSSAPASAAGDRGSTAPAHSSV